jgi:hypothetical protein
MPGLVKGMVEVLAHVPHLTSSEKHRASTVKGGSMPDDPKKRGPQDRAKVSKQEHEQRYQQQKKKSSAKKSK